MKLSPMRPYQNQQITFKSKPETITENGKEYVKIPKKEYRWNQIALGICAAFSIFELLSAIGRK